MDCIKKIKIDDTIYTADTDFRTAIKCNEIATNNKIGDFERTLAVICTVFGEQGLDNPAHYNKLLEWIKNYLSCGKEIKETKDTPDMDYVEDMDYIVASFQSDYNINLDETKMDWKKFNNLINGLSNSDMGNCCVLNRIRNIRNADPTKVKDKKERDKLIEAQKSVELKKYKKENNLTEKQKESVDELYRSLGIKI